MNNREKEYRLLFLNETQQSYDQISSDIVKLEKNPGDEKLVGEIFRLLHNMKANAATMDMEAISALAHQLENVFSAIRSGSIVFEGERADVIFRAIDYLGYLISDIDNLDKLTPNQALVAELDEVIAGKEVGLVKQKEEDPEFTSTKLHLSDSVSIPLKKLDELLNLVGELFISRDHILSFAEVVGNQEMKNITQSLSRIADNIQDTVMTARLVTVSSLFNKFPKIIRDIAADEGKHVNLIVEGMDTTIDRNVLKVISDVMIHLIRNAIIHGLELPKERIKKKKPAEGELKISASSEKGLVYISVSDDGRGVNSRMIKERAVERDIISSSRAATIGDVEALGLLFSPGFSMADEITEYAGRGVGLDIVKNVIDSIGGDLRVESKAGKGTKFTMALPISMAVKAALLFKVSEDNFAVPLLNIHAVITVPSEAIHKIGEVLMLDHKGESIELVYLNNFLFRDKNDVGIINLKRAVMDVIIVWYNNKKYGLVVDKLLRQQEIMIKPLQEPLDDHELFSGVTLLGSGEVCYVLDVGYTTRMYEQKDNNLQFHS